MDVIGRLLIRMAMLAYSQIGPTEW